MTTAYIHRTTVSVPVAHLADANQLALCLGESSADDQTFGMARYQDTSGNLYAICSTVAKPVFQELASQPLQAPAHAPDADLDAASRAQALLSINDQPAGPDRIAVILGDRLESAMDHIAALGLTAVPHEEEL